MNEDIQKIKERMVAWSSLPRALEIVVLIDELAALRTEAESLRATNHAQSDTIDEKSLALRSFIEREDAVKAALELDKLATGAQMIAEIVALKFDLQLTSKALEMAPAQTSATEPSRLEIATRFAAAMFPSILKSGDPDAVLKMPASAFETADFMIEKNGGEK